jgi:hypothetical protein
MAHNAVGRQRWRRLCRVLQQIEQSYVRGRRARFVTAKSKSIEHKNSRKSRLNLVALEENKAERGHRGVENAKGEDGEW